jgi:hypothetical protein
VFLGIILIPYYCNIQAVFVNKNCFGTFMKHLSLIFRGGLLSCYKPVIRNIEPVSALNLQINE